MDQSTDDLFPDKECRLILIGKTGAGKSSTGNTILGYEAFLKQAGINSETKQCGHKSAYRNGLRITVTDTPGLSDTDGDDNEIALRIAKSLLAVHQGPHAIVLVLRCDHRFTEEEVKVYNALKDIFGKNLVNYLIIILVGLDQLASGSVFEKQLEKATQLQTILKEANNRYVLFNNKATGDAQIQQIDTFIAKVKDVMRENNTQCFLFQNAKYVDDAVKNMVIDEIENMTGRKLSVRQEKPRETPTASEKEESESTPVHRREAKDLGKLQAVKAARARFEPSRPQSEDLTRYGCKGDSGTELPVPCRKAPPPPESPAQPMSEGTQNLAEMLEELAIKDKLLDQLRASYDEEYNHPEAEGRSCLRMAEDLVLDKVLNKEEELSPGQKQVLDKTQKMVDLEVRNGMKRNSIKDVRVLAKCSLM